MIGMGEMLDAPTVDVLMEAMQRLSSHRCGALFALKRGIDLKPYSESGVELDAGLVHVDAATGSILKTFSTESSVELVLLGQALPTLGVPVNAHLHANGAAGIGAGRS
jgi:hypothetical protein